jgi:hypothetical protein
MIKHYVGYHNTFAAGGLTIQKGPWKPGQNDFVRPLNQEHAGHLSWKTLETPGRSQIPTIKTNSVKYKHNTFAPKPKAGGLSSSFLTEKQNSRSVNPTPAFSAGNWDPRFGDFREWGDEEEFVSPSRKGSTSTSSFAETKDKGQSEGGIIPVKMENNFNGSADIGRRPSDDAIDHSTGIPYQANPFNPVLAHLSQATQTQQVANDAEIIRNSNAAVQIANASSQTFGAEAVEGSTQTPGGIGVEAGVQTIGGGEPMGVGAPMTGAGGAVRGPQMTSSYSQTVPVAAVVDQYTQYQQAIGGGTLGGSGLYPSVDTAVPGVANVQQQFPTSMNTDVQPSTTGNDLAQAALALANQFQTSVGQLSSQQENTIRGTQTLTHGPGTSSLGKHPLNLSIPSFGSNYPSDAKIPRISNDDIPSPAIDFIHEGIESLYNQYPELRPSLEGSIAQIMADLQQPTVVARSPEQQEAIQNVVNAIQGHFGSPATTPTGPAPEYQPMLLRPRKEKTKNGLDQRPKGTRTRLPRNAKKPKK